MSKKQGKKFVISEQKPQECEYCGKIAELRPYGKNGANICFKCAMEDEQEAKKQFGKKLNGVDEVVVVNTNILN
jgi:hypothetical protein